MLVVGDQEAENGAVNVRKYGEQKSETVSLDDFVKKAVAEAKNNRKYKTPFIQNGVFAYTIIFLLFLYNRKQLVKIADHVIRRNVRIIFLLRPVYPDCRNACPFRSQYISIEVISDHNGVFFFRFRRPRQCSNMEASGFPFPKAPEMTISLK